MVFEVRDVDGGGSCDLCSGFSGDEVGWVSDVYGDVGLNGEGIPGGVADLCETGGLYDA